MHIVYLDSTAGDFAWMRYYYETVFPQGRANAQKQFHGMEALLQQNPYIGHLTDIHDIREFSIPKTPFSYIYRVCATQIEVLHIWDERRDRDK
ncbi:MAG: hypothetical protein V3V09_02795 [Arenicellales bacterium]